MERHYLCYPRWIAEVLSPTTEIIDRREKLLSYVQIPTLEEYVLVSQEERELVVYRRSEDWRPLVFDGAKAVVEFRSLELSLRLEAVYSRLPGL